MKEEIEKLQGTWNVVDLEVEGQKMPAGVFTGSKIVVKGNSFTTIAMGATYDGTLEVDATRTPKTFNLMFTTGPEKGNTSFGIYELDEDTWKICLTITGNNRPEKFATAPRSGHALETLRRERAAHSQHPDQSASEQRRSVSEETTHDPHDLGTARLEPLVELGGEWSMVSCIRDGHTHGPSEGKTQYGIYELEGKTLRLSFSAPGQGRPTDFTTTPGDGRTVTVWSLVKR